MFFLALVPGLVVLLCLVAAAVSAPPRKFRWWFLRVGLVPLIGSALAFYLIAVQPDVPLDYDELRDPDIARLNFMAAFIYGFVVPGIYLVLALPIAAGWVLWKRRGQ
ncbi:hypothetical protein [Qipengyuania mesophila]|uniref:hypothetical protein n=1 Tax=Qipengyuania mesophila TaxID=2867246 RepID=UPI003517F043